jgi:hypothetical protein
MLPFKQLSFWEKQTYINHTDFLIIGSGIVGLSTAIYLKERFPNKKVTVIERGYLPTGASSKNAGFACIGSPSELLDDLSKNNEDDVFTTVENRWKGLLNLRKLLGDSNIDYQNNGSYELFNGFKFEKCVEQLAYLNNHLKSITGINTVFEVDKNIIKSADFNGFKHAISHKAEGQLDTGKMIYSLWKLAIEKGAIVINGIEAKSYKKDILNTDKGTISFKNLIICTNGFAKTLLPNEDIEPARAQVMITKPIENLKFKGIYHFEEGYYYFRNVGNRVLFGGGRNLNFDKERTTNLINTNQIINTLSDTLKSHILPHTDYVIEHTWAGIMGVGQQKSPIVKQLDENIYCGVRLGGMGVAIGSLVGQKLSTLVD